MVINVLLCLYIITKAENIVNGKFVNTYRISYYVI